MSDKTEKFRSVRAFRDFEQRKAARPAEKGPPGDVSGPSPLRVLAVVKKHPSGVRRTEVAEELHVDSATLENPVLQLLKDDMVRVEAGADADDEVIFPS